MRTTLNVDDDVLEAAKRTAHFRRISVGEALSEMARQGMNAPVGLREDPDTGFLVFDLPKNSATITPEDVARIQAEIDEEDARKYWGPYPFPGEKAETGRKQARGVDPRENKTVRSKS